MVAAAQTQSNIDTAISQAGLNMIGQQGPGGSIGYEQVGTWADGTPRYQQTTSLSPGLQSAYDASVGAQGNIANLAQQLSGNLSGQIGQSIQGPNLQTGVSGLGNIQASLPGSGAIQGQVGDAGSIQTGLGDAGEIRRSVGDVGNIQGQVGDAGAIRGDIDPSGSIQASLGTDDWSADRQRVEDALMGRLSTQLDRDRSALEQRLANQGITIGSDAYTRAMDDFSRSSSDARTSAILGAGQEQNRLQQLALNAGQFGNQAQQQQFLQNLTGTQLANQAQQQQYGQNLTDAQFANQAQAQQYGQGLSDAQLANLAQQQQFGQNLAGGQFANEAQAQQFGQNLAGAQFGNQAQQQQFGQDLAAGQFGNLAQQQGYDQAMGQAQFGNQAQQQMFQNQLSGRSQGLNELMSLLGGSQVQMPQFSGAPQTGVAGTDVAGIQQAGYNNQMAAYNAQNQQMGGLLGTVGSVASAALPFILSDERMKDGIERIGETDGGSPLYRYRYKGDESGATHIGVLAQEEARRNPDAVVRMGSVLGVDYGKVR